MGSGPTRLDLPIQIPAALLQAAAESEFSDPDDIEVVELDAAELFPSYDSIIEETENAANAMPDPGEVLLSDDLDEDAVLSGEALGVEEDAEASTANPFEMIGRAAPKGLAPEGRPKGLAPEGSPKGLAPEGKELTPSPEKPIGSPAKDLPLKESLLRGAFSKGALSKSPSTNEIAPRETLKDALLKGALSKDAFAKKALSKELVPEETGSDSPAGLEGDLAKEELSESLLQGAGGPAESPNGETLSKEPLTKEPLTKEPLAKAPLAKQSLAKEPLAKEPMAKEPLTKEPLTKEPLTKEPLTKQPVVMAKGSPLKDAAVDSGESVEEESLNGTHSLSDEDDVNAQEADGSTLTIKPLAAGDFNLDGFLPAIRIIGVREAYTHRRLWDAVDSDTDTPYVLEERKIGPSESVESAAEFDPPDDFSNKFIFNPISRKLHAGRVVTLFEAPQGRSLEEWRRMVGRDGATPSAIINVLRPVFGSVQEFHEKQRVHLHLNPRTIWISRGTVGFTGVDGLESIPVARTRFRATVGFSAPEVFGRSKQHIDIPADIYSLGAIVYYLVAGIVPPVSPETAFAPALSPRDFHPSFPPGWSEAILRATDPVPQRRFPTASAFFAALESGLLLMQRRASYNAPLVLSVEAERHIGYSKKLRSPVNQDNTFIGRADKNTRFLIAVADGVSTATFGSGDLASGFLVSRAEEMWNTVVEDDSAYTPKELIKVIIERANVDIVDFVNERFGPLDAPPSEVMGSTALVAYVKDGVMTLGSLGDSRAYLIRRDLMECLTRDHNLFTLSLVEGVPIEDVLHLPHGDALARCLGTFDIDEDGYLFAHEPPVDMFQLPLVPGDNILLCTDGLFDYAGSTYEESEGNIRRIVLGETHPGLSCLELILLANRGGGGDNIGVALLKVFSESGRLK